MLKYSIWSSLLNVLSEVEISLTALLSVWQDRQSPQWTDHTALEIRIKRCRTHFKWTYCKQKMTSKQLKQIMSPMKKHQKMWFLTILREEGREYWASTASSHIELFQENLKPQSSSSSSSPPSCLAWPSEPSPSGSLAAKMMNTIYQTHLKEIAQSPSHISRIAY